MSRVEYRVRAHNTAGASENKIHDDTVARRFGFRGGLVPGVDVYAYLTHPIVARWGRPWLERGTIQVQFLKPAYDGEEVIVICDPESDDALRLEARNPAGDSCATARATLPRATEAPPEPAAYPSAPMPDDPAPVSPESLAPGTVLGTLERQLHADRMPSYLIDVRETLPLYRDGAIAHPAYLLRHANYVLAANVRLGPWIHVASDVQHFGTASAHERVSTRARVAARYEKKGHRFVELDVLMLAGEARPLLYVRHTAIYEPRSSPG